MYVSTLKDLYPELAEALGPHADLPITGLAYDSGQVKPGDLFFAYPGASADGRDYVAEAIAQGAVAIAFESELPSIETETHEGRTVVLLKSSQVQAACGDVAARFYQHPSQDLKVIGITGTNGKSSCVHYMREVFLHLGHRCESIGTLGVSLPGMGYNGLTTPHAIDVQKTLADMRDDSVEVVAMEVSAHGLSQHRVDAVEFDVTLLSNIARDHLNDYATPAAYAQAKKRLFEQNLQSNMIFNTDDVMGLAWAQDFQAQGCSVQGVGQLPQAFLQGFWADQMNNQASGLCFQIQTSENHHLLQTPIIGRVNVMNILASVAALCVLQYPIQKVVQAFEHMSPVPGRFYRIASGLEQPTVYIDYAHTDDALAALLSDVRDWHPDAKITAVFGCGGGRDQGKRPLMTAVALELADQVVLTSDNPRFEDPQGIIDSMLVGQKPQAGQVHQIIDRAEAIAFAIQKARASDVVVITGKGQENFNWVQGQRLPHSDVACVQQAFEGEACS